MHIQWKKLRSSLRSAFHSSKNIPPEDHATGHRSSGVISDDREADDCSESKRELVLEDMFANDASSREEESRNPSQEGPWSEKRNDIETG